MKHSKINKLLVTTGLQETWGKEEEELILLGDWCNSYENIDLVLSRRYKTINYHWSDRDKLRHDYDYLSKLFERVLVGLVSSLNNFHNTDYSLRYWRIILGPWLLSYVSVLWDRWENIRVAFDQEEFDSTVAMILDSEKLLPINFDQWDQLIIDDLWNHHIFTEIIKFLYNEKVNIIYVPYTGSYQLKKINRDKKLNKEKLINKLDELFGKIQKNYKVVFVSSYFTLPNLVKLSLKLKQLPRIHSIFSQSVNLPDNLILKRDVGFSLKPNNIFEEFLEKNVLKQIPIAYLEGYKTYRKKIAKIDCDGEVIFTANAHLRNDIFNAWCAKKVEEGKKLIISQHGGGIKSEMTVFRHQEKIADKMVVWHKPLESVHVQLPPNKLINIQKKKAYRSQLTIVGYEPKIYINRAQSGPKGGGVNDDFLQKLEFCKNLSIEVNDSIRVRSSSHGSGFFNSGFRYRDALGDEKISTHLRLHNAYSQSKVIVCTYPQTTFSEALNSGIPTILLYSKDSWEFDENFQDLITQLKNNQIIFTCPKEAANHINSIWDNPDLWWNKSEIIEARQSYFEMCGKASDNWASEWASFFKIAFKDG